MKYTITLTIALPRERVVALLMNPEHWHKWQETIIRYEQVSGSYGETGSKIKLFHKYGNKTTEIVETIELQTLPKEIIQIYEATGVWNRVHSRFVELNPNETQWEFASEFKCGGMLKIIAWLMPNMFKKTSQKDMESFAHFAVHYEGS